MGSPTSLAQSNTIVSPAGARNLPELVRWVSWCLSWPGLCWLAAHHGEQKTGREGKEEVPGKGGRGGGGGGGGEAPEVAQGPCHPAFLSVGTVASVPCCAQNVSVSVRIQPDDREHTSDCAGKV